MKRQVRKPASTLTCPMCARVFLIESDFVMELGATGRIQASRRAEIQCRICSHTWWSKHPEALRRTRRVGRNL